MIVARFIAMSVCLIAATGNLLAAVMDVGEGDTLVTVAVDNNNGMYGWFDFDVGPIQRAFWDFYENGNAQHVLGSRVGYLPLISADKTSSTTLDIVYLSTNGTSVSLNYQVQGGSSGETQSTVNTTLTVSNTSATATTLDLYFSALTELRNTPQNDRLVMDVNNRAVATEGFLFAASEIATLTPPDHVYVGPTGLIFPNTAPPTLNDDRGPYGPGAGVNPYYAYQWNKTLAPGESFTIGIHQYIGVVPEPSTWLLMALGFIGTARRRTTRVAAQNTSPTGTVDAPPIKTYRSP